MSEIWVPVPPAARNGFVELPGTQVPPGARRFVHASKLLVAVRSRDAGRWHLSVSHRDRVPTWDELGFARDSLLPEDVWVMVPHPPRRFWMNLHPHVLHLIEFRDPELQKLMEEEGREAQRKGYGIPRPGGGP